MLVNDECQKKDIHNSTGVKIEIMTRYVFIGGIHKSTFKCMAIQQKPRGA